MVRAGPKKMHVPRHFPLSMHTGKVGFGSRRSVLRCWLLEKKQEGCGRAQTW